VREVHEILQTDRRTGLTTTLKILQVMEDKGLVTRNESRPHRYGAAVPEEKTQAGMLNDLVRRAFNGSVSKLLIRAVEDGNLSSEELQEIRRLIDSRGKGGKEGK
jgi:predicted transcriptional regulator